MPHREVIRYEDPAPTLLGRLWDTVRSYTGPLRLTDPELARKLGWSSGPTAAGVAVNADSAMGVPAIRRAVLAIAGDVGSLPLLVYRRLPQGGKERDGSHRLHRLLHDEANNEQTAVACREALTTQAVLLGNAYAEIERDQAGRPVALWPMAAGQCHPERDAAGRLVYVVRNASSGDDVVLPPRDVLHLRGPSYDGLMGLNPLVQSRDAIAIAIATERHVGAFYQNGCSFGGTITHPKILGDTSQQNLRKSIEANHKGSERAHRFLVLEEGMSFTPNGVDPERSQLQAAREFNVREAGRVFGVPPSRLGDSAQISYATSEQEALQYFATTVRPWLIRWEQMLMSRLLSTAERQTYLIEHNADALLRSDSTSRANFMRTVVAAGVYTRNECRALDNLPPMPGGDQLSAPLNTGALPGESIDNKESAA